MIEIYIVIVLLGLGFYMKDHKITQTQAGKNVYSKNQLPSMDTLHKSDMTNKVRKIEYDTINSHNNNVIKSIQSIGTTTTTGLKHNNMLPFLRGNITQNVNPDMATPLLEKFGAKDSTFRKKQEVAGMFVPEPKMNRTTFDVMNDLKSHVPPPTKMANVLSFSQEKVGKGIGGGFTSQPFGGFQQPDYLDKIMPKNVDELRVKSKPKFGGVEGRIIDGKKEIKRGLIGKVDKLRPDTYYENTPDKWLKTTGAVIKESVIGEVDPKYTNRTQTQEYTGIAYNNQANEQRGEVLPPHKNELENYQAANVKGVTSTNDYGKGSVQVYTNERNVSTTNTYKGNVQSLIKAIVTPIQDIIKISKKEFFLDPTREFGELNAQIPSKITVRDPNDVLRTTIKETTVHDSEQLNVKGPVKLTVYDPNDVARTTVKQTTIQDNDNGNMASHVYRTKVTNPNDVARTTVKQTTLQDNDNGNMVSHVYRTKVTNPNDVARTTVKQTSLQDNDNGNMASHVYKIRVNDPNDVAKTTIKETLLQDSDFANFKSAVIKEVMYKEDKSKPTIRQTLDDTDMNLNLASTGVFKGISVDPSNVAKTTIKETTLDDAGKLGIASGMPVNSAYQNLDYDVKNTQQETYTDEYYGSAKIGMGGEGYKDANYDVKITMKENHDQYFGIANNQDYIAPMSQDDSYNATTNGIKESTLIERAPTTTGVKAGYDINTLGNTETKKIALDTVINDLKTNITNTFESDIVLTKQKQWLTNDDRLDMEILEPFNTNPYTQSLHSY